VFPAKNGIETLEFSMSLFRRTSQVGKTQPSLFFDPWAEGALVTEDGSDEPKVLYHGTTHQFDAFDPNNPYANPEGYWGKGFYFSDSYHDVNTNYAATDSPDVEQKINTLAERMISRDDWYEMDLEPYKQSHPEFFNEEGEVTHDYELAKIIARERLLGSGPSVMPVYLKMKKPLNATQESPTYFDLNYEVDEEGEYTDEASGTFLELQQAVIDTAYEYGLDGEEFWNNVAPVLEIKALDGYLTADEVFQALLRQDALYDIESDEDGNSLDREFIKDVFQRMGYDGVIMNAWQHFGERGMRGINPDTRHYITWDPTNIKSAIGNNGLYDPANPVITASITMNQHELIRSAAALDAQGRFAEADALDARLQRLAKDQSGVKAKADEISREFLGMYTIHSIAGSNPKAAVVVYADDLSEIPSSVKKKMRAMAKPYDVRFERSEDPDDASNRLEELI
jgi:hypothetical protein